MKIKSDKIFDVFFYIMIILALALSFIPWYNVFIKKIIGVNMENMTSWDIFVGLIPVLIAIIAAIGVLIKYSFTQAKIIKMLGNKEKKRVLSQNN